MTCISRSLLTLKMALQSTNICFILNNLQMVNNPYKTNQLKLKRGLSPFTNKTIFSLLHDIVVEVFDTEYLYGDSSMDRTHYYW